MKSREMQTTTAPRTVAEWQDQQRRQRLQIEALDGRQAALRGAELVAILEVASVKIDRFGWNSMDPNIKDAVCNDWCDLLSQYTLAEVKAGVAALFAAAGGKLKSINEFQVQEQIKQAHRQVLASLPKDVEPEPERKPVDRERAAEILAQAGYAPKRFGAAG